MRVLGVDPGTYRMGVGVVCSDGPELTPTFYDVLSPNKRDSLPQRLHYLYENLLSVINEWKPMEVAIEEPFAARNVRSAMAIGQAQAVAMVAAARNELPVYYYAPRQVKQAVTDYGGSSKEQVQEMVQILLSLDVPPESQDAADALAVAICHLNTGNLKELIITE